MIKIKKFKSMLPKPAFSESCTGMSKVSISLCLQGNVCVSSKLLTYS